MSERKSCLPSGRREHYVVHLSSGAHLASSRLYVHVFTCLHLVHSATETTRLSGSVGLMPVSGEVPLKGRKVGRPHRTYVYFPLTRSAYILVLTDMCAVGLRQVRAPPGTFNTIIRVRASCSYVWYSYPCFFTLCNGA
jgi:hypothetical protein